MESNNLTRQGVRNLNGPQRNARMVSTMATCFHDWTHDPDCACDMAIYTDDDFRFKCSEVCRKCPARR